MLRRKSQELVRKQAEAREAVKRAALTATGVNFVPIPWFDLAGVGATLTTLLTEVCGIFEVDLSRAERLAVIGVAAVEDGLDETFHMAIGSLLKHVPFGGHVGHAAIAGTAAGALVWGIGEATVLACVEMRHAGASNEASSSRDFRDAFKKHYKSVAPTAREAFSNLVAGAGQAATA